MRSGHLVLGERHFASCTSRLLKNGPRDLLSVPVALFSLPEKTFGFAV